MSPQRPVDVQRDDRFVVPTEAARSERARAFEGVYRAHSRDVERYLLGLTRSVDEADEITSETFERAFRAWDRVPDPVLPWLLLTARRIATDRWRRARRLTKIVLGLQSDRYIDAGERGTEFWMWFDAVARVLTDRQREVLLLRYQRDLTDEDIATIMGLSASGVRSLVARALDALRAHPELL